MNFATKSIGGIMVKNSLIGYYLPVHLIITRIMLMLTDSHKKEYGDYLTEKYK